ncbi:MAG: 50S ribosomal protein L21 [Bacteroidetes bacterium]|nr:50S ribosomal protein L21 [Bacteroidota bacterium]
MFAIVDIAGQQFKVSKDQEIFVHRLEGNEGDKVEFDGVLLIDNDGKVVVGTPVIQGAQVQVKILEHLKADKVLVFKKKRRKGYQKLNGHRQYMTRILIEDILEQGGKKKKESKPAARKPKAEVVAEPAVSEETGENTQS